MSNRGRHKKSKQHLVIQILGIKIANRMMECQKEQGNIPNLDVFLKSPTASRHSNGFNWSDTKEGHSFWDNLIVNIFEQHSLYKKWRNDRR